MENAGSFQVCYPCRSQPIRIWHLQFLQMVNACANCLDFEHGNMYIKLCNLSQCSAHAESCNKHRLGCTVLNFGLRSVGASAWAVLLGPTIGYFGPFTDQKEPNLSSSYKGVPWVATKWDWGGLGGPKSVGKALATPLNHHQPVATTAFQLDLYSIPASIYCSRSHVYGLHYPTCWTH